MKLSLCVWNLLILPLFAVNHNLDFNETYVVEDSKDVKNSSTSKFENRSLLVLNSSHSFSDPLKYKSEGHSKAFKNIDMLGDVLKKNVEMLRLHGNQKVDMVFLVDASFSVGDENFKSELKFVKKLLADFTVSLHETRVAVITFSDPDKVVRHVDHISIPSDEHHKCNMLLDDFANIHYVGGNTYTLGALIEAQSVLEWSRAEARKAVFLITDGFSNGGDPEPVADILKKNGTYIFTFGIRSGNLKELRSISSSPVDEFSYLLESFDQFEALARRALHQDLSVGSFKLLKNNSLCDNLCPIQERTRNGCCDGKANCACGTGSGRYTCVCPPSYYGSGRIGSCYPCPNGTYHDGRTPGDESICLPCPDPNHETILGKAVSKATCLCKRGFVARGETCEVITCPPLYPPEHGYFVKGQGMCPNVFNAACGMRCKVGYSLYGTSIRLCQENGTWSGKIPSCVVKMCPNPDIPKNGFVECSRNSVESNDAVSNLNEETQNQAYQYAVDTECRFTCRAGYVLIGSRRRTCLPLARWNGLRSVCRPVLCSSLPKILHGFVTPTECTEFSKHPFGQVCNITCESGYQLVGPSARQCGGRGGQWSRSSNTSKCSDVEPPQITCPENMKVPTEPGQPFAIVNLPYPVVYDNSGEVPLVWTQPALIVPIKLHIGQTPITYIAMDSSNNQASCIFDVSVMDIEPPAIYSCVSPNPVRLLGENSTFVTWDQPEFLDNSGRNITIHSSHNYGEYFAGRTEVVITATDWTGNNSTCFIEILLIDHPCSNYLSPINHASIECKSNEETLNCVYACQEGYSSDPNGSFSFTCPLTKISADNENDLAKVAELPKCVEVLLPNAISQRGAIDVVGAPGVCQDLALVQKVQREVTALFSKHSGNFCRNNFSIECHVLNASAICEEAMSALGEETSIVNNSQSAAYSARSWLSSDKFNSEAITSYELLNEEHYSGNARWPRETNFTSFASKIHVDFNVVIDLRKALQKASNPGDIVLRSGSGFGEIRESLTRTNFTLPQGMRRLEFHWRDSSPNYECPVGSVILASGFCVKCSPGSFFSNQTGKCLSCPVGEYQEGEGSVRCVPCPFGMTTKRVHSRRMGDCQRFCPPGSYGQLDFLQQSAEVRTVPPCFLCASGSYQPNYGSTECLPCPYNGLLATQKGSKSVDDCFKSPFGDSVSLHCDSKLCQPGGSCRKTALGYLMCDCLSGFYGSFCELRMNRCGSNPCLSGGTCVNDTLGYACACPQGFEGINCEVEINECNSKPCFNNARCEDLIDGFYCDCSNGFQGKKCEEDINDCADGPCGQYGLCSDGIASYTCTCLEEYSGRHCEIPPSDPCFEGPCMNGASCFSNNSFYECRCPPQWTGKHCNLERDSCLSLPCANNGLCVKKGAGEFSCRCRPSFSGTYCQTRLLPDYVLHLSASSVTDYAVVDFPPKNLSQISVCLWLQSTDDVNYGTVFSYAVGSQFNALTFMDYSGFVLYVNGAWVVTDISTNDGQWHHLCVLWRSQGGVWSIYVDGSLKDNGTQISPNSVIAGSGKFVLGQEQDTLGGGFSEAESLIGRIYRLDVWDYLLVPAEISNLAEECHQSLDGTVLSWTDFLSGTRGNMKAENSTFCADCPPPEPLWRGAVTTGVLATYLCDRGFVFHRTKRRKLVRRCLKHGAWEGSTPICVRLSCGFPGYLPGGTFEGRSFLYADKITYKCHTGYQILGNTTRTCGDDGQWSGVQPVCKGHDCTSIAPPKNGMVIFNETSNAMQVALFYCNPGFHIEGAEKLLCMLDGTWDETKPECLENLCPPPPHMDFTVPKTGSDETFHVGEKLKYICIEHYEMTSNEGTITCGLDGTWVTSENSSFPKCVLVCPKPDNLRHGSWVLTNSSQNTMLPLHFVGTVVEAKCDLNYKRHGPFSKHCGESGYWLPEDITQCAKLTCETDYLPYEVPNSLLHLTGEEVGDTATLSCRDGFQMRTTTSTSTNISQSIDVNVMKPVINNSLAWTCDSDGSWNMENDIDTEDVMFACLNLKEEGKRSTNCSKPMAPAFGYIIGNPGSENGSPQGTSVEVRCRPGYILEGSSYLVCDSYGTWVGLSTVECKPVQCLTQPRFPNMIIASTTAVGRRMEFGNMVILACIAGFSVEGDLSVRCQSDGQWSPLRGTCKQVP